MKNKNLILGIFGFIFLLAFLGLVSSQECISTDGGNNHNVRGKTTGLNSQGVFLERWDYCADKNTLVEYYCADGIVVSTQSQIGLGATPVKCPYGCLLGRCLEQFEDVSATYKETTQGYASGSCTSTTRGKDDFWMKGKTIGQDSQGNQREREDFCKDDKTLIKYYCADGTIFQTEDGSRISWTLGEPIRCDNGCQNGACVGTPAETLEKLSLINQCVTKDGTTIKYDSKGEVKEQKKDSCAGEQNLYKYSCDSRGNIKQEFIPCGTGKICLENECVQDPNYELIELKPNETGKPIDLPSSNQTEDGKIIEVSCMGCLADNKCYPLGYVRSGEYCSDSGNFTIQGDDGASCENLFECKSGVCVGGQCLSEGFIQKILNWFRKLFG